MGIPSWKDFYFYFMNNISHTQERYDGLLYEITLIRPKDNEIRETPYKKKNTNTRKKSRQIRKRKKQETLIIKRRTLFIITNISFHFSFASYSSFPCFALLYCVTTFSFLSFRLHE